MVLIKHEKNIVGFYLLLKQWANGQRKGKEGRHILPMDWSSKRLQRTTGLPLLTFRNPSLGQMNALQPANQVKLAPGLQNADQSPVVQFSLLRFLTHKRLLQNHVISCGYVAGLLQTMTNKLCHHGRDGYPAQVVVMRVTVSGQQFSTWLLCLLQWLTLPLFSTFWDCHSKHPRSRSAVHYNNVWLSCNKESF